MDRDELVGPSLLHPNIDTNTTSTESSDLQNPSLTQFSLDEDGRIHPYINFDLYYQAIDEAKAAGLITESQMHIYKWYILKCVTFLKYSYDK